MSISTRKSVPEESEFPFLKASIRVGFSTFLILCGLVALASAQAPDQDAWDDPWGVCLFEHPDYLGAKLVYTIEPGIRQRAVEVLPPDFEDKVSSIKVGANVDVQVFEYRFWGGWWNWSGNILVKSTEELGTRNLNDKISSIVVYPKAARGPLVVGRGGFGLPSLVDRGPLGVWGWGENSSGSSEDSHLFPVPDSEDEIEARYPELGRCDLDKNMNVVGSGHAEVSAVLYEGRNFQGASLSVPGADSSWAVVAEVTNGPFGHVNLGRYGWSDRAASLIVRWTGPSPGRPKQSHFSISTGSNYPGRDYKNFPCEYGPAECEKVCLADPNCKAFTWVKPGVQGPDAVCWLKTEVPQLVTDSCCISGSRIVPVKVNAPPTKSMTVQDGVNLPGGDYRNFALKGGPADCERACETEPNCKAFTWVKPGEQVPDAVCWLKNTVPAGVPDKATVSGWVEGSSPGAGESPTPQAAMISALVATALQPAPSFTREENVDRRYRGLSSHSLGGKYEECQEACARDPKCKCFTYIRWTGSWTSACYLMDSVPVAVSNRDATSGVRQESPPPSP